MRLKDKIALITGGARGQGAAEAKLFAEEGATVVVTDLLDGEGERLAGEINTSQGRAVYLHLDVTSPSGWENVVTRVDQDFGGLDILINNAGINIRQMLADMKIDEWDTLLEVNLKGPLLGIRACAPLMKKRGGGSIVNVGSLAGLMGHPTTGYSAAKWGLRGLTKSAAMDLVGDNIRVNAMHPGLVETPIIDKDSPFFRELVAMTPMHRPGHVDELAKVALFLASDDSSFITGADIPVDGGLKELGAYASIWNRALAT